LIKYDIRNILCISKIKKSSISIVPIKENKNWKMQKKEKISRRKYRRNRWKTTRIWEKIK